jgi:hypothetical protein
VMKAVLIATAVQGGLTLVSRDQDMKFLNDEFDISQINS